MRADNLKIQPQDDAGGPSTTKNSSLVTTETQTPELHKTSFRGNKATKEQASKICKPHHVVNSDTCATPCKARSLDLFNLLHTGVSYAPNQSEGSD